MAVHSKSNAPKEWGDYPYFYIDDQKVLYKATKQLGSRIVKGKIIEVKGDVWLLESTIDKSKSKYVLKTNPANPILMQSEAECYEKIGGLLHKPETWDDPHTPRLVEKGLDYFIVEYRPGIVLEAFGDPELQELFLSEYITLLKAALNTLQAYESIGKMHADFKSEQMLIGRATCYSGLRLKTAIHASIRDARELVYLLDISTFTVFDPLGFDIIGQDILLQGNKAPNYGSFSAFLVPEKKPLPPEEAITDLISIGRDVWAVGAAFLNLQDHFLAWPLSSLEKEANKYCEMNTEQLHFLKLTAKQLFSPFQQVLQKATNSEPNMRYSSITEMSKAVDRAIESLDTKTLMLHENLRWQYWHGRRVEERTSLDQPLSAEREKAPAPKPAKKVQSPKPILQMPPVTQDELAILRQTAKNRLDRLRHSCRGDIFLSRLIQQYTITLQSIFIGWQKSYQVKDMALFYKWANDASLHTLNALTHMQQQKRFARLNRLLVSDFGKTVANQLKAICLANRPVPVRKQGLETLINELDFKQLTLFDSALEKPSFFLT